MRNLIVLTIALLLVIPMTVQADEPPAHGNYHAGWGMNPNNWNAVSGSYNSGLALYDPDGGQGSGGNWVVGYDGSFDPEYIQYAEITLDLWVELYMVQTYRYTSYQWHRIGNNAEDICFIIEGTLESNERLQCSLTPGSQPMSHLWFVEGAFGGGSDIPLTWEARWGDGHDFPDPDDPPAWQPKDYTNVSVIIPKCDHWFQFRGCFHIDYHIDDGHYSLTMAGCPGPTL
ncbi:MAG: hypothetical protein GF307_03380 [candidate division Zixibacteria bacterium]|nr:hypothetical protein [candidate division Zixibacteria bacterium]